MSETKLEQRLTALEIEVAELKKKLPPANDVPQPWWEITSGTFADDPAFEEAMELGKQYRKSSS
jgi:hypothetical protein